MAQEAVVRLPGGKVVRLVSKRELMTREAASRVDEFVCQLEGVPVYVVERLRHELFRLSHPAREAKLWPGGYTMLSREQTAAIWDAIRALPPECRPNQVRHAFDLVLLNLRWDTGEVMLTRDELAERMGCVSRDVSTVMGVLARLGVIERQVRRVPGMKGPGMVAYFVNPHAAWHGELETRSALCEDVAPPLLTLMEGGKV